ncbi:FHA domain-containing protein [Variovorax sp. dw_954]|uniref:FHA domain-containing protein n=1 Tax=Variovorax sp. dw_954 TaxID=2720078 RepID=UPI001BD1DD23|nr:FHA domain-containing protein [Variovorax sp. dw_954]
MFIPAAHGSRTEIPLRANANSLARAAQNDIVVDSVSASRRHARIIVAPAFVTIEDLGSSNGTYVNGERVQNQVLADGDAVRIGTFEMRL